MRPLARAIARFLIALAAFALAIFGGLLIGKLVGSQGVVLIAIFGMVAVYYLTAFGLAPWVSEMRNQGRYRVLVGTNLFPVLSFKYVSFCAFIGFFLVGLVLHLTWEGALAWLGERGGAGSLYLTASVVLILTIAITIVLRALLAPLLLVAAVSESALRASLATLGESLEAAALLCSVALCLYGLAAGTIGGAKVTYYDENGKITPGEPTAPLLPRTQEARETLARELVFGLSPVITLTSKEGWWPQRVDAYLSESTVHTLSGRLAAASPESSATCAERDLCLVVSDSNCPDSPACEPRTLKPGLGTIVNSEAVAYARVLWRDSPEGAMVRWDEAPFSGDERLVGVVQWFMFAPYDKWTTPLGVVFGQLEQSHGADWESVTIGFSARRPEFVAFSAHCGGSWRRWKDVNVENDEGGPVHDPLGHRLHVLAAYADGSHAMYFEPEDARSPDSTGCEFDLASGWLAVAGLAANLHDRTGDHGRVLLTPITGAEAKHVLEFPAFWSVTSTIKLRLPGGAMVGGDKGTIAEPQGPKAPASEAVYRDPIHTIFSTRTWHYDRPGS